jgi:hypothetical protein
MKKIGCLLMALPLAAFASDWLQLDPNYFIDRSSISSSGKYKKAWFSQTLDSPKDMPVYPYKKYLSNKILKYFNCEERTTASAQNIFYSEAFSGGESVGMWRANIEKLQFDEVAPDTVGERDLLVVCSFSHASKNRK